MENNQNNISTEGGEKKNGGKNRHRHFHNRHRNKTEGEKKPASATGLDKTFFTSTEDDAVPHAKVNEGVDKPKGHHKKHKNKNRGDKNNQPENKSAAPEKTESKEAAGGKSKNDRRKNHHNKNNRGKGVEQRPYSPYEEPAAAELSLEELRARIVLNSASEKPRPEPEPVSAEAVEAILAGGSSVTPAADETEKEEVIGVRFRSSGKTYYFAPNGNVASKGDFVVVETARGAEFGEVSLANTMISAKEIVSPLRPVCRIATESDIKKDAENRQKEKEALGICQARIEAHKLDMKLIDVQYAFDNSKLLFYFSAEGRVDFRELVKDLASTFRTRIELRQIGIRDEAKLLGGLGACGRALCCSTFLPDFAQVSIKMAKDQNLSLNSAKISGLCGRLMCCLRYEQDVYVEAIKQTPQNDTVVKTEDGIGTVISSNPLAGTVRVILKDSPDTPPKQYHRDSITVIGKTRRDKNGQKLPEQESSEE